MRAAGQTFVLPPLALLSALSPQQHRPFRLPPL